MGERFGRARRVPRIWRRTGLCVLGLLLSGVALAPATVWSDPDPDAEPDSGVESALAAPAADGEPDGGAGAAEAGDALPPALGADDDSADAGVTATAADDDPAAASDPPGAEVRAADPPATVQATLTVHVSKTNDANGDGLFTKTEDLIPPVSVVAPFSVTITNTSSVPVVIIGLTDQNPIGTTPVPQCPNLIGTVLFPGQSVICNFTANVSLLFPGDLFADRFKATVTEDCLPSDPTCQPGCPDPPILPLPPQFENCVPGANIGEGEDDSGVRGRQPPPPPPPIPAFTVQKTNNADGVLPFSDQETAPTPGAPVTFQVVVTNTSTGPITVTSVVDQFSGQPSLPVCPALLGSTIAAGQSVTCTFTLPNYSPGPGDARLDAVYVTAVQPCPRPVGPPTPCPVTVADNSIVFTQGPPLTIKVDKTNDADGDGTFTDVETAPGVSQAVTFRVVVTNTSTIPLGIGPMTDVFPGQAAFSVCAGLIGTQLPPGASSPPCTFTVPNYSPPVGPSKVDTVTVTVGQACSQPPFCRTASASDTSTVNTKTAPIDTTTTVVRTSTSSTTTAPGAGPPTTTTVAPTTTVRPRAQPSAQALALTGRPLAEQLAFAALAVFAGLALWRGGRPESPEA